MDFISALEKDSEFMTPIIVNPQPFLLVADQWKYHVPGFNIFPYPLVKFLSFVDTLERPFAFTTS